MEIYFRRKNQRVRIIFDSFENLHADWSSSSEAFSGTPQADAYGGYQAIDETGRVGEATCWRMRDGSSTGCMRHALTR